MPKFFPKLTSFILALMMSFAVCIDTGGNNAVGDSVLLSSMRFVGTDGICSTQGITNDGEYFYLTGAVVVLGFNSLTKVDMKTGEVVLSNKYAMPKALKKQTFNHLGGCTYHDGKIYIAVEDVFRKHPCIAVFSAETLEFTGTYRILGEEIQPNGNLPWCAADEEKGVLYTGISRGGDFVNVLDLETLDFIERKPIEHSLYKVQGAEYYDGTLYISCNDESKLKHVYAVDLESGKIETVLERDTGKGEVVEAEGMTICPTDDGGFYHVLDVVTPWIGVIRTYSK